MPYVPPGPSSSTQACIPRRSIVKTVMDQTREKNGSKPKGSATIATSPRAMDQTSLPPAGVDLAAATSSLADDLEVTHIAQPAISTNVNLASGPASSVEPSPIKTVQSTTSVPSSDASSSIDRTDSDSDMEAKRRLSSGSDAATSYKTAMYQYTRNLMKDAEGISQKATEKAGAFPQFGAKQSGMQRMAAKKALARQLNA